MMAHDGNSPLWRVLGCLDDSPKKSRSGYEARCPAHEDRHRSLSIGLGDDGRVLLDCHTGCSTDNVLAAMGLDWADLFEKSQTGNPVRRFRLVDSAGHVVAEHVREDVPGDGKKIHWERNGKPGLNGTAVVDLPLYRAHTVADMAGPIVLCEGEKAAQALADIGVAAVATVTGADQTPSDNVLSVLQGKEVWLWPDNDQPGREHMARIALKLKPQPKWINWKAAPAKGDAADYVAAGGTAKALESLVVQTVVVRTLPRIWRGDELATATFDAVRWAIPGILPSGLTILAGRPKLGKSWLMLGWAVDVARGAPVLRRIDVEQGETLYLALEDSPRRMQERQAMVLGDARAPRAFHLATEWPRMNEGGLEDIEQWIDSTPNARLVLIDTFKKFRPKENKILRLYDLDYDAVAPMAELATRRNIAIVLVFHTNKQDPNDPVDLVSGTLGLSGAADGVLVLKRERGQADASLFITGRDVEEQDLALKLERDDTYGWALLGPADQFRRSKERAEILRALEAVPGMKPSEIAAAVGKTSGAVRYLLFRMVSDGEVRSRDGGYWPMVTSANANAPNALPNTNAVSVSHSRPVIPTSPVSTVSGTGGGPLCPLHHVSFDDHECEAL